MSDLFVWMVYFGGFVDSWVIKKDTFFSALFWPRFLGGKLAKICGSNDRNENLIFLEAFLDGTFGKLKAICLLIAFIFFAAATGIAVVIFLKSLGDAL